jgi:cell division protein ZapE
MSLLAKYESIIASGLIRRDPQQVRVLSQLQLLCDKQRQSSSTKLRWQQFFRKTNITNEGRQGMYLYGGVGSGKTMLMDLFYDNCPEPAKRRVHYNAFMLNVHSSKL